MEQCISILFGILRKKLFADFCCKIVTQSVKSCAARTFEHQLQNSNRGPSICQIGFTGPN